jgi:hypothetical protein
LLDGHANPTSSVRKRSASFNGFDVKGKFFCRQRIKKQIAVEAESCVTRAAFAWTCASISHDVAELLLVVLVDGRVVHDLAITYYRDAVAISVRFLALADPLPILRSGTNQTLIEGGDRPGRNALRD